MELCFVAYRATAGALFTAFRAACPHSSGAALAAERGWVDVLRGLRPCGTGRSLLNGCGEGGDDNANVLPTNTAAGSPTIDLSARDRDRRPSIVGDARPTPTPARWPAGSHGGAGVWKLPVQRAQGEEQVW